MGANAQTTVQKFVDGAVLTAAQQNISAATGVPVFATTVTRDAAFGGANKVLAEGQLAYIEATDVVQYYTGAAWASVGQVSKVVQMVNTQTGEVATGSTTIPFDDTIPQNTEGDQYMTLAITPTSATNKLLIRCYVNVSCSTGAWQQAALFQDSIAGALAATMTFQIQAAGGVENIIEHTMTAGTTSATTFKVRAGMNGAGTTTFNGTSGGRHFGGVMASSITITEYTP